MPLPTSRPTPPAELIADLYRQFGDKLLGVAYRVTGSHDDAEDVVHDVFVGLPEALRQYEERGQLQAWLKRVTVRVALTRLRRRARSGETSIDDSVADVRAASEQRLMDTLAVQRAIAALPEPLRLVVVLREIEGYSHAEIAALLEISTNASEVRLHRALKQLRAMFGESR